NRPRPSAGQADPRRRRAAAERLPVLHLARRPRRRARRTAARLDNGRAVFRRAVLETTGLADPAPAAMAHPYLVMRYRLDGVIAVVDAVNAAATLDAHMESVKQVAVADRIVLTKTDLLTTAEGRRDREALTARLHLLNPAAPILDAAANEAAPERL